MVNGTRVGSWVLCACVVLLQGRLAFAQSLAAPWISQDIGVVGLTGSASSASGVFTVRGAGADIWGTADGFQGVLQPVTGDAQIVVRVNSMQNTNTFAKAGVMLRATTGANAAHVILDVRPNGSIEFMTRPTTGAATTYLSGGTQIPPAWLKLTRAGTLVTGFVSADGTTWTPVGSTTLSVSDPSVLGMVVTSHNSTQLNTASFDHVSVTTNVQPPWVSQDIGIVGLTGSASSTNGVLTVRGAGADIWGANDAFRSVLQPITSDGQIVVRVYSLQDTNTFAKAGVMLRSTTAAGAGDVILDVRPNGSLEFMTRASTGAATSYLSGGTQATPTWLKLTRIGMSVTGYVSADGAGWTQVGTTSLPAGPAFLGLAVTSHDATKLTTAVFDNLSAVAFAPVVSTPFNGTPMAIPGYIVTENFDNGGEGVGYHDSTPGNSGGQYRATDVDIQPALRGGFDIGWIADGEWLAYSVNVATAGTYQLQFNVASPSASGKMHATFGGTATGTVAIPNTGSWQSWSTVSLTADLVAGPQLMTLVFDTGGFNLAGVTTAAAAPPPATPQPPAPKPPTQQPPAQQPPTQQPPAQQPPAQPAPSPVPTTYSAPTDRIPRPKPALPTIGGAGSIFTDPAFGSKILRVTDANTRPASTGVSFRTPSAGPQIAWDMASKYFYVTSTDGTILVYSFDASTMTATRVPGPSDGGLELNFYVEPQFSSTKPGVIYGISGVGNLRTVYQYDLSAGTYTSVLNLDTVVSGVSGYVGAMMTGGTPTEYLMTFFGGGSQDQHYLLLWAPLGNLGARKVINTLTSTINGVATNIPLNFKLHAATIDRSGRYVFLHPTAVDLTAPRNASQAYIWDTSTDVITAITSGGADGGPAALPGGHGAPGFGVGVNHDCCTSSAWDGAQWQFRSLATPLITRDMINPILTPKEVYLSDHATWANAQPNVLVPIISATYRYAASQNTAPWRAWDDEIIAIETDGAASGMVWRFAHHRSDIGSDSNEDNPYFWYEPRPSVSPDGRWVIFTSNWEKTLGTDVRDGGTARQDVFLLRLD
jgi:regulation of enolase protein 1 (concanavalin A-like superfamily)